MIELFILMLSGGIGGMIFQAMWVYYGQGHVFTCTEKMDGKQCLTYISTKHKDHRDHLRLEHRRYHLAAKNQKE